ncbi:hypothetical protein ACRCPS_17995 [Pseudomonas aeruginosa]
MQADLTEDGELLGNTLSKLKARACEGNARAAGLLGRKYHSGHEEFHADLARSRRYLTFAASRGEGTSATDLVMQLLAGGPGSLEEARKWLQVAQFSQGRDAVLVRLAENALEMASKEAAGNAEEGEAAAGEAAVIIHFIRNGLPNPQYQPPCQL